MSDEKSMSEAEAARERLIDLRNDLIVQAVTAAEAARKLMLVGLGMAAVTMDEGSAWMERFAERGELAESDLQSQWDQVMERIRRRAGRTSQVREEMTAKSRVALSHSLDVIRDQFD